MNCPKCGYAMSEFDAECPRCKRMGEQKPEAPPSPEVPPPSPAAPPHARAAFPVPEKNTSGTDMPPPLEVMQMGWSWGAFGLNWIWAIGNQVWVGLLALVPVVSWIVAIWLGIAGHQMAWKKRRFDSYEQYRQTMRVWNNWGLGLFIANFALPFLFAVLFPVFGGAREKARQVSCLTNEKQIVLAMLQYCQDYDEVFPIADNWQDGISAYLMNDQVLYCPSGGGYGYNKNLSMCSLGNIETPGATGALFEADADNNLIYPHRRGMNVGYTDGHCKWVTENEVKKVIIW